MDSACQRERAIELFAEFLAARLFAGLAAGRDRPLLTIRMLCFMYRLRFSLIFSEPRSASRRPVLSADVEREQTFIAERARTPSAWGGKPGVTASQVRRRTGLRRRFDSVCPN